MVVVMLSTTSLKAASLNALEMQLDERCTLQSTAARMSPSSDVVIAGARVTTGVFQVVLWYGLYGLPDRVRQWDMPWT